MGTGADLSARSDGGCDEAGSPLTRRRLLIAGAAGAAAAVLMPWGQAAAANDYPWQSASQYPTGLSPLRFYYRNCTDFTAWRLNKQMGVPNGPWKFTWGAYFNYSGGDGNARGWKAAMERAGFRVDATPALGSVAWWGTSRGGGLGHVAIVTAIRAGGSVDVESYNGINETWYPESAVRAEAYLHVADLAPAGPNVSQYAGHLVQWKDEKPSPVTTWLVGPDLTRTWVPDGGTFNWMKSAGAPGPSLLGASDLDALRDRTGVRATTDQLGVNWSAPRGIWIWSTANGYCAVMQGDGNFVVYKPGGIAVWASRTAGARVVMQGDGNLVIYDGSNRAVWSSGTAGHGRSRLVMQGDGNLVVYRADGRATWATMTNGGTNRLGSPAGFRL